MKEKNKTKIFLVDDDALFLKLLEMKFLQDENFDIQTFLTGELCVLNLSYKPDIIILDYHLNGIERNAMNGIETLDKIKAFDPAINVVILSSQDKIEVAVNCMRHKAFDYVVKSETAFIRLQNIITEILAYKKMESIVNWYKDVAGSITIL